MDVEVRAQASDAIWQLDFQNGRPVIVRASHVGGLAHMRQTASTTCRYISTANHAVLATERLGAIRPMAL